MQQDYGIPISEATEQELVAELRRRGAVACVLTVDDIRPLVDAEEACAALDEDAANEMARTALLAMRAPLDHALNQAGSSYASFMWSQMRSFLLNQVRSHLAERPILLSLPTHRC